MIGEIRAALCVVALALEYGRQERQARLRREWREFAENIRLAIAPLLVAIDGNEKQA